MKTVHLYIDNLRIGGFQRLCLDQAYALSQQDFSVELHVLSSIELSNPSFLFSESSLIDDHRITVHFLSEKLEFQLKSIIKMIRNMPQQDIVISHSLRATALLWIGQKISFKKFKFITTIHQLPTLSAPRQRLKRFVYSQLSPVLTAYSEAVVNDWNNRVNHFPVGFRRLFNKKISILRNGIFLPRITNPIVKPLSASRGRLIFLGRISTWKGLETFFIFARYPRLENFNILVMVPEISDSHRSQLKEEFGERIQFQIGKSFNSYTPMKGDVHFYAAQYGDKAKFIESISLNCLEMASVGTPSVVTQGGLNTWPELKSLSVFWECDWINKEATVDTIIKASQIDINEKEILGVRDLIDINRNLLRIREIL